VRFVVAGLTLCALLEARMVVAQEPDTGRIFFDVVALAAVEQRGHVDYNAPVRSSDDLSHVVPGEAVAVGTFLAPRVSLRVEAAFPWSVRTEPVSPSSIGDAPTLSNEREYGNSSVSVLLGYSAAVRRRVRVGYMGGVAFVRERSAVVTVVSNPGLPPIIPARSDRTEATTINYRPAVALGMDVEIPFWSHVSLVPQIRVVAFTGELSIRPGLALRWLP
jgi:hypothetical protein